MAFGFCASRNFDTVLSKLEQVTKTEMVPKSSGFLGLMKVCIFCTRVLSNTIDCDYLRAVIHQPFINELQGDTNQQ